MKFMGIKREGAGESCSPQNSLGVHPWNFTYNKISHEPKMKKKQHLLERICSNLKSTPPENISSYAND